MNASTVDLAPVVRLIRTGHAEEALPLLTPAVAAELSVGPARLLELEALVTMGRRPEACAALARALDVSLASADAIDALAFFARQLDRHELSNSLYKRTTELAPHDAGFWYNFATSERSLGRLTSAAAACETALRLDPNQRSAVLLRSELTRATDAANHVEDLRRRIAESAEGNEAMFLLYALGKELHDLGEYDAAFEAFREGAAARRRALRYDVADDEYKLARIAEAFPSGAPPRLDLPIGRHIFIVGLPRSGTTLTERILGGLANVASNNETNNFSSALLRCAPAGPEDVFARAARADSASVAREYEALAVEEGFTGKVIEKLPFNYLYVGPILRAFPNTPVLWVRRHPLDNCFAMFRTLFAAAYPFSYDFSDLARYYAAYQRLMAHWEAAFPDQITRVSYEDLVRAPANVGPQLATRAGLEWADHALDISRNTSASLTASASQVREGIYATSSGLWRRYQAHLEPLADALASCGVALEDT